MIIVQMHRGSGTKLFDDTSSRVGAFGGRTGHLVGHRRTGAVGYGDLASFARHIAPVF